MCSAPGAPRRRYHETFGDERLLGALLDRLTHFCHILEFVGESYRFRHSQARPDGGNSHNRTSQPTP